MARKRRAAHVLSLKISLAESNPLIWRRVLVHSDTTLHGLHRIIQLLMQWYDYHLYVFTIRGEGYEAPDPEAEGADATKVKLGSLDLEQGERFSYLYDFGDDWEHEILVEAVEQGDPEQWLPWLVDGEGAGPPEDCGGMHGFEDFLQALADPKHSEHKALRHWVGEDYDPNMFDVQGARHALLLASAWGVLKK